MPNTNQRQGGQPAEESMMLCGGVLLFLAAGRWFVWHRFHGEIAGGVMAAQHWQMQVIGHFTQRYLDLDGQVTAADPSLVGIDALWRLLHNVGAFFRIPAAVAVAGLAVACLLLAGPSRFTRDIDLPWLMQIQAEVFPSAAAFVGRDLRLVSPQAGTPRPCDPALTPAEWVRRFAFVNGHYDAERAEAALSLQLGPPWRGLAEASPQVRCVFAAFAVHAARRRQDAIQLLGTLSNALPNNPGDGPSGPAEPLAFGSAGVAEADGSVANFQSS